MQTHIITDSKGNHYLRQLVKKIRIPSLKPGIPDEIIPRYTTRRWDPTTNSPIPRIRMSKKLRLKLKRHLCNSLNDSSNFTVAPAPSTSPA